MGVDYGSWFIAMICMAPGHTLACSANGFCAAGNCGHVARINQARGCVHKLLLPKLRSWHSVFAAAHMCFLYLVVHVMTLWQNQKLCQYFESLPASGKGVATLTYRYALCSRDYK